MGFSSQEYWSGLPFPSLGDLPDPGSNAGLSHCRQILYCLSHQGSPMFDVYVSNKLSEPNSGSLYLYWWPWLGLDLSCLLEADMGPDAEA